MTARLLLFQDGEFTTVLDLGPGTHLVGRGESCDLVLDNPTVSRQHFTLTLVPEGHFLLQDLGAENGTYVDGVREFGRELGERVTIQAGNEMLLFDPGEGLAEAGEAGEEEPVDSAGPPEAEPSKFLPSTSNVAPILLRRLQAEMRIRVRPHLVLRPEGEEERLFALGSGLTPIGYGNLPVSLGPAPKKSIVAEVVELPGGGFEIRSTTFFSKVRINGKSSARERLRPGDSITIGSQVLVYHPGLEAT